MISSGISFKSTLLSNTSLTACFFFDINNSSLSYVSILTCNVFSPHTIKKFKVVYNTLMQLSSPIKTTIKTQEVKR